MGVSSGPKIASTGLVLSIDANNQKSISPLGCAGFNGAAQLVKNLVSSRDTISSTAGVKLDNLSFYTAFAIDYPEGSIGGDAADRQGITPGFNVRSGTKLYDASRALHLWVWNNNTSSWVSDSYFHGLRLAGHCYDNYSGAGITATELALFVSDYNTIKNAFPNCTYIVSGGHRADTYNVTVRNIFTDLGMPSGYIDSDFISAPEWILIGKPGLGRGNAYGWTYENYSTNTTQVAHLNFGLPIYQGTNNYLGFNGTDDYISTPPVATGTTRTVCITYRLNSPGAGWGPLWRYDDWRERIFPGTITLINNNGTYYELSGPDSSTNIIHIAYSYNGTNAKSYRNGVLQSNITMDGPMTTGNFTYNFGRQAGGSTTAFIDMDLYSVQFYNIQLSDDQIQQNFNALRSRFGI
jgi:hypothetical protein